MLKIKMLSAMTALLAVSQGFQASAQTVDPNDPGILEPVLSATTGQEVRIPNTDQAAGPDQLNVTGLVAKEDAFGAVSLTGHVINRTTSPNDDMAGQLKDLSDAAGNGDTAAMTLAAQELLDILLGTTQGRIYDGFAMLNFNRGAFVADHVPGEYKMKAIRDTGQTAPGIDGQPRKIWEVDVAMLWYDGQFDSDTFLVRVPVTAHEFDTLRVNYRIYSLVREDFAPTTVLLDRRMPGSVQFPFKGLDSVWVAVGSGGETALATLATGSGQVASVTVEHPPLRLLRGIYTWGWRVHPPRIQFIQPIYEMVNAHTGAVELEPQGKSFAFRNRQLSIAGIGDAAPEKKMYQVAQAVLAGASPAAVAAMVDDDTVAPLGTWQDWANLAKDQNQLPAEAQDLLAAEGIAPGQFGPYRFISVFMNNEMYGEGPLGNVIQHWNQGDRFQVKLINLDNHTHYFRNVDFGARLHDDVTNCCGAGSHSFEIMNFKPTYGAPKVAEAQWRAGWGFRPHFDVIQQQDVFPRLEDSTELKTFFDGAGNPHQGYQYSVTARGGDFRFNPPNFIIGTEELPSAQRLKEADGTDGLVVGQLTEGYGIAKMCSNAEFPLGTFCARDIGPFNPHGVLNRDTDGDGLNDALWFPPFLRNPNAAGGDIIPPTPAWKPFLWINPNNGTLFNDPADPSQGFWVDQTYSHGAPVLAGQSLNANVEGSRAAAQVFYQFDDLFHDNDIFSPHPTESAPVP